MAQFEHLSLKRLQGELVRRKPPGFGGGVGRERQAHGAKISNEVAAVLDEHAAQTAGVEGVDPSLILRLEIAGLIDESEWGRLGLTVLSEDQNKTLLLFANDKELQLFRLRLESYMAGTPTGQKNPPYAGFIDAIESVGFSQPKDRIGRSLLSLGIANPDDFDDEEVYLLDVELFHPAANDMAEIFVYRLGSALDSHGGTIINTYIGEHLLLCRVEASGAAFKQAINLPEVAMIEVPPAPDLQEADLALVDIADVPLGSAPLEGAVPIAVIDSGVNSGHPLLSYAVKAGIVSAAAWLDADENGHGTSVASMVVYGDILSRVEEGNFDAPFWVVSARVVDAHGHFPKEISVPEVMDVAIRQVHKENKCRIFNISLGDENLVYNGGKVSAWTSTLDELARELDILIVVSSGNRNNLTASFGDGIIDQYPAYLTEAASRILEPGTAANVLTVGSLAHCNGLADDDDGLVGVLPVCGQNQPSPFTRCGPGIRGMIKPDLVDYGGSAVWDGPTQALVSGGAKPSAGVWGFHHEPVDRLFRARSGTSFAAPLVAHKAAIVLDNFPDASANFLRAILALSGEHQQASIEVLDELEGNGALMVCGNGIANVDTATFSDDNRVIFYAEDEIVPDRFAVFEVPIPEIFQSTAGVREIKVSLAFDPPVRRTRADYLGLHMGWRLLRGASEKQVFDKFRTWEEAEGDPPEFPKRNDCSTSPGPQLREKGTLQCASFTAQRTLAEYGDKYYIAVWCRRRWAPIAIKSQRFALAVQLRHSASIKLYQSLTLPVALKA